MVPARGRTQFAPTVSNEHGALPVDGISTHNRMYIKSEGRSGCLFYRSIPEANAIAVLGTSNLYGKKIFSEKEEA
jgi:hypothetical protein